MTTFFGISNKGTIGEWVVGPAILPGCNPMGFFLGDITVPAGCVARVERNIQFSNGGSAAIAVVANPRPNAEIVPTHRETSSGVPNT